MTRKTIAQMRKDMECKPVDIMAPPPPERLRPARTHPHYPVSSMNMRTDVDWSGNPKPVTHRRHGYRSAKDSTAGPLLAILGPIMLVVMMIALAFSQ